MKMSSAGERCQPYLELTRCERVKAQSLSKVRTETNLILNFGTLRVTYSYKETQTRIVDNQMGDFERQMGHRIVVYDICTLHPLVLGLPWTHPTAYCVRLFEAHPNKFSWMR